MVIDYSKPTSVVFQDLTKYIIARDEHLDVLFEHLPAETDTGLNLPSWCPDWRVHKHRSSLRHRPWGAVWEQDDRGASKERNMYHPVLISRQALGPQNCLHFEGFLLAIIRSIDAIYYNGEVTVNNSYKSPIAKRPKLEPRCKLRTRGGLHSRILGGDIIVGHLRWHLNAGYKSDNDNWPAVLLLRARVPGGFTYVGQAQFVHYLPFFESCFLGVTALTNYGDNKTELFVIH